MLKILLFIFFISSFICRGQNTNDFVFKNGDFVFQDLDCGELCDAIEKVTPSYQDKHFSHVGLVVVKKDSVFVVEAIGKNVHLIPIQLFLNRQKDIQNHPKVLVKRLNQAYNHLIAAAIDQALQSVGIPYDDYFLSGNGKYYCSELILESFKQANNGVALFNNTPMTFKDPKTHQYFKAWVDYYKALKTTIPEGKPGCNPGSIANSDYLDFVYSFY